MKRTLPPVSWATTVHFIISDKFKILFCFVPKVACTTWKDVMKRLYHNQIGKETKKRFLKLDEIGTTPSEVIRRWRDYRKVLFVREPLSRVLSAYLNKFRYGSEKARWERAFGAYIVKRTRTQRVKHTRPYDITFEEFIRYILHLGTNTKMNQMKDHWLPYSSFTSPCRVKYDYIGHYETLAQDGPEIVQRLGIREIANFPTIHNSTAMDEFRKEYANIPVDLIVRLQAYYHADYELFGYSEQAAFTEALAGRTRTV